MQDSAIRLRWILLPPQTQFPRIEGKPQTESDPVRCVKTDAGARNPRVFGLTISSWQGEARCIRGLGNYSLLSFAEGMT